MVRDDHSNKVTFDMGHEGRRKIFTWTSGERAFLVEERVSARDLRWDHV